MKKSLIMVSGVMALAAGSFDAAAQSSVTLSGIIDVGVQQWKAFDGTSQTRVGTGFKSSRLIFSGSEDMGGGLRANFRLESGYSADTGALSSFGLFHRSSWVGLSSTDYGALRLGRALVPTSRAVCAYADLHDCGGGFNNSGLFYNGTGNFGRWISAKPGRGGNNNEGMSAFSGGTGAANSSDSGRVASAVFYDTPVFAGVQGSFVYAPGEAPDNAIGDGAHKGAGVSYRSGPASVSLNYERTNADPLWNAKGQMWTLGGVYAFGGGIRVGAVIQRESASGPQARWSRASAWAITAAYRMGNFEPYTKFGGHRTNGTGSYGIVGGRDAQPFEIGTTYDFSKRTTLYFEHARDLRGSNAPGANRRDPTQWQIGLTHTF
jgi:predicted porin